MKGKFSLISVVVFGVVLVLGGIAVGDGGGAKKKPERCDKDFSGNQKCKGQELTYHGRFVVTLETLCDQPLSVYPCTGGEIKQFYLVRTLLQGPIEAPSDKQLREIFYVARTRGTASPTKDFCEWKKEDILDKNKTEWVWAPCEKEADERFDNSDQGWSAKGCLPRLLDVEFDGQCIPGVTTQRQGEVSIKMVRP
jgi:hypothetical protein